MGGVKNSSGRLQEEFDRIAAVGIEAARVAFERLMPGLSFRLDLASDDTTAALPHTKDNIRYDLGILVEDPEYERYNGMRLTDNETGITFNGYSDVRGVVFQVRVPLAAIDIFSREGS